MHVLFCKVATARRLDLWICGIAGCRLGMWYEKHRAITNIRTRKALTRGRTYHVAAGVTYFQFPI